MDKKKLTIPPTEVVNPDGRDFDRLPISEQLRRLLASQAHAIDMVQKISQPIAVAVEAAAERLRGGEGRLIYAGAGCSIRIGVQDGVELVPTFGWPLSRVAYLIAGGSRALSLSVEGAEDDISAARQQMDDCSVSDLDVVIGITASGNTRFTCQILESSIARGALTIGVSSNPSGRLIEIADYPLVTMTGSEVLAGSTRLGAGTAQKALLNCFSTALMTQLGRVLGNEMLCVQANNRKLKDRQARILAGQIDGMDETCAYKLLSELNWDLRKGLLIASGWVEDDAALALAEERPFRKLFCPN